MLNILLILAVCGGGKCMSSGCEAYLRYVIVPLIIIAVLLLFAHVIQIIILCARGEGPPDPDEMIAKMEWLIEQTENEIKEQKLEK